MKSSIKKSIIIIMLVIMMLFLNFCHASLLEPKGEIAENQKKIMLFSLGMMLIVVIPVIFMTLWFVIKYKKSNVNSKYTPNWNYSRNIELLVWIIPVLIIFCLSIIAYKTTHKLEPSRLLISKNKPIKIDVIALDWRWLFIYPKYDIATINEISFPKNVPIQFRITSNSVMNSFFIPSLGSQIYAMPCMSTTLNLMGNNSGKYNGISSNYSGKNFSNMKFTVLVQEDNFSFISWIKEIKSKGISLNNNKNIKKIFKPSESYKIKYFSGINQNIFKESIQNCYLKPNNYINNSYKKD
ncbi:ubiquinol oxidase subunit II [Buchnera aphidicola (Mindarus keteleerifoliae)]|uniref:ubiquinol oxidase subunit II n=1 Tax=Buchnera aphidicola TaxID=9 RepID=UPI0031B6F726